MAQTQTQSNLMTENLFIAEKLRELGDLLEQQEASQFRVKAYHDAASFIAAMSQPISETYHKSGKQGLVDLPTIGVSIAAAVAEILESGRLGSLERLRGSANPERLLQTVPMIGPTLAHLIHDTLDIDTLEALEIAAVDGRLNTVKGIGHRRVAAIRHALNDMLGRRWPSRTQSDKLPPVADILVVDLVF